MEEKRRGDQRGVAEYGNKQGAGSFEGSRSPNQRAEKLNFPSPTFMANRRPFRAQVNIM